MSPPLTAPAAAATASWLELIADPGPFLTVPVACTGSCPTACESLPITSARVRAAVAEILRQRRENPTPVVDRVLADVLDWGDRCRGTRPARSADRAPCRARRHHPTRLRLPRRARGRCRCRADEDDADRRGRRRRRIGDRRDPGSRQTDIPWRLLGTGSRLGHAPARPTIKGGWTASPVETARRAARARDVPVGVVTDGRWWALVWAPRGGHHRRSGLGREPVERGTRRPLQAFVALLDPPPIPRRPARGDSCPRYSPRASTPRKRSPTTLGRQVREAVEMLVATLDRLDRRVCGRLLAMSATTSSTPASSR